MKRIAVAAALAVAVSACVISHLTKEIPPPGGCDQCHRQKILANWEVTLAPAPLGRQGGIPEDRDVVLRDLQAVPYHREVSAQRLAIYAASAPQSAFEGEETGIQCFLCHRSPGPPHDKTRGNHPWGQRPVAP